MKKVFMILGTCLMAALVVFSCSKKNNTPTPDKDKQEEQKPDDQKPEDQNPPEDAFSMEISIDGDFSDWDVLTADKADESYVIEENSNADLKGLLCVKATSDKDYIYLYAEIDYEDVFVAEGGPFQSGDSNTGFTPTHPGSPGPLWVWIDGDGDKTGAVSAFEEEGQALWGTYAGFDAPLQYYFCYDVAQSKMQLGWQQVNWPIVGGDWDGSNPDKVLLTKDSEEWGRSFIVSENWDPNFDNYASEPSDIAFSAPVAKGSTTIVKIEIAMARTKILPNEVAVADEVAIGVAYENVGQEPAVAHGYLSEVSGKLPSGNQPFTLKLL